jgi:ribosome maturation factor RimP
MRRMTRLTKGSGTRRPGQQHIEEAAVSIFQTREQLATLLDPVLGSAGLDLEDVQISQAGRRRLIRVLIDQDGGVTLDDVADATRLVSAALDAKDALGDQAYTLEVSSRGTDRPLTLPRHWRRNHGRLVRVETTDGRSMTGRIAGSDEQAAVLVVDGTDSRLAYVDVAKALVQVEFSRSGTDRASPAQQRHETQEG